MSYFRVALQREMERRQLIQSELARQAGISRSHVSRVLSGEQGNLSDEDFMGVLKVFSADGRAQAELVAARCMDARVGPGSEMVEIIIRKSVRSEEHEKPETKLSEETERAFAWLRSQCPGNVELERHIIGYAKIVGME